MKKIFTGLFISIILLSSLCAKENLFSGTAGLSTGVPFYGSKIIDSSNKEISNPARIIIGTFVNGNLNILDEVSLFAGADLLFDFNWNNSIHSNHIHFSIPFGIKAYPHLKGFSFGLAYMLGFRADFINYGPVPSNGQVNVWGNGFKLFTEYNFAKEGKYKFLPTVGFSWSLMPRGSSTYDNILTFYTGINF